MKIGDDTIAAVRGNRLVCRSFMNLALLGLLLSPAGCAATVNPHNPSSPFEAVSTPDSGPPMLKFVNTSAIETTVDCSGESVQSISIPPGEQREVRFAAGQYSCTLHGGDAIPYSWFETYQADTFYSLKIYTRTVPVEHSTTYSGGSYPKRHPF